jgi:hypothetical protein
MGSVVIMASSARSVGKYALPRNASIPDMGLGEVLASEPLLQKLNGVAEGVAIPLFRGADPGLSMRAMLRPGQLFKFKIGWLYVQEAQLTDAQRYFEAARIAGKTAVSALADQAGLFKDVIEGIGDRLLEARPSEAPIETAEAYLDMLRKRGTVVMAGVNLVEVDHQVDPAGLLFGVRHRLIVTYERPTGERATYSLRLKGASAGAAVDIVVQQSLETRWWGELTYLLAKVRHDRVDVESVAERLKADYLRRYGGDIGRHLNELFADYQKACDAELERQGFGQRELSAAILVELAPMIPYLEPIPALAAQLTALRALADTSP